MKNKAEKISLVAVTELQANPKNPNKHSPEQIARLAKMIEAQGFRQPLVVSKESGFIVTGHGRYEAARFLGLEKVPVIMESFDSPEDEYAHMVADNGIAQWSALDLGAINLELGELGPNFDLDLLGIKGFTLDVSDKLATGADERLPDVDVKGTQPESREVLVISFEDAETFHGLRRALGLGAVARSVEWEKFRERFDIVIPTDSEPAGTRG